MNERFPNSEMTLKSDPGNRKRSWTLTLLNDLILDEDNMRLPREEAIVVEAGTMRLREAERP